MTTSEVSKPGTAVVEPSEYNRDCPEVLSNFLPVPFATSAHISSTRSNRGTVVGRSNPVEAKKSAWKAAAPPDDACEVHKTCSHESDEEEPEDSSAAAPRAARVSRLDASPSRQALLLIQGYTLSRSPSPGGKFTQPHLLRKTKSPISRPRTPRSKDAQQPLEEMTVPKTDIRSCCRWRMEDKKHLMLMEWLERQG